MCKRSGMYNGDKGTSLTGESGFDRNGIMRSSPSCFAVTLRKDLEHVAAPAHYKEDRIQNPCAKKHGNMVMRLGFYLYSNGCPPAKATSPIAAQDPKDFPKYFSGRSEAPVTTIFIGGKNEASNLFLGSP